MLSHSFLGIWFLLCYARGQLGVEAFVQQARCHVDDQHWTSSKPYIRLFFLAAAQCRSHDTLMQDADLSLFCAFVKSSPIVRPAVTLPCCKTQDARRTFEMHVPHALRLPARDRFHVGRRQRESIARERLSNNGINNSSPRYTSKNHSPLPIHLPAVRCYTAVDLKKKNQVVSCRRQSHTRGRMKA